MAVTLKYRIIELLSRDISKLHSISDIAKKLGVAYSHTHSFVIQLVKENVIDIQKIGNVSVCKLNLKSAMTRSYLSLIESRRTLDWMKKNPQASKTLDKLEIVKDSIHAAIIKGNRIILIVPEKIKGADFSMFRNRTIMSMEHLKQNKHYYTDCVILHGAEKFWGMIG